MKYRKLTIVEVIEGYTKLASARRYLFKARRMDRGDCLAWWLMYDIAKSF